MDSLVQWMEPDLGFSQISDFKRLCQIHPDGARINLAHYQNLMQNICPL